MRAIVRSYVKKTLSRPVEVRVRGLITSIHTLDPHPRFVFDPAKYPAWCLLTHPWWIARPHQAKGDTGKRESRAERAQSRAREAAAAAAARGKPAAKQEVAAALQADDETGTSGRRSRPGPAERRAARQVAVALQACDHGGHDASEETPPPPTLRQRLEKLPVNADVTTVLDQHAHHATSTQLASLIDLFAGYVARRRFPDVFSVWRVS
jgi:hypothetical protein